MKKAFTLLAAVTLMFGTAIAQVSTLSSAKPMQNSSKTVLSKMLKSNRSKVAGNPIWRNVMSYCEDGTYYTRIGTQATGDTVYWAIKIEAAALVGRNNITSVEFFVPNDGIGTYTVKLVQGTITGTVIATQTVTATDTLMWKDISFTAPVAITQGSDLWVIMSNSDVPYPAATIYETNDYDNAKWISLDGVEWTTIDVASGGQIDATWMIRVTTDTYIEIPPVLDLQGPTYVRTGDTAVYYAHSHNSDSYTWTINADHLDTTLSSMAEVVWNTPGTKQVIVMASNTANDTYDTLDVTVYSCDDIALPYIPQFTNGLNCWDTVCAATNNTGWWACNELGLNIGQVVSVSVEDYSFFVIDIPVSNWLTSPVIEMPATGSYEVAWQVAPFDLDRDGDHYAVYAINGDTTLLFEESLNGMTNFTRRAALIPSTVTGDFQIAFRHFNALDGDTNILYTNGYAIILDSIQIRALTAPVMTFNGPADIENGDMATYTVTCGNAGSLEWAVDGITVNTTGNVLTHTFTTDGLHTVTVTATNSVSSTVDSVVTDVYSCNTAVANFPYAQGFEHGTRCWTMVSADTANNDKFGIFKDREAHTGNYDFCFSSYNHATDYNQYLISPELNLSDGQYMVKFFYRGQTSSESFRVLASSTTNAMSAFTEVLGNYTTTATEWTEVGFLLPAGTKYIAIDYYGDYVYYLFVDDITIKALDEVPTVELVGPTVAEAGESVTFTANAPLATSFAWTVDGTPANSSTNQLDVAFSTSGNHTVSVVASNTFGASTPASINVNVYACEPINAPWTESFENNLQCWHFVTNDEGSAGFQVVENAQYAHQGSNSLIGTYNDYFDVDQWAISPVINMPANATGFKLSFFVLTLSYEGINSSYEVLVSQTGGTNFSDFTRIYNETSGTGEYRQHVLDMSSYAGKAIRIAFRNITAMGGDAMFIDDIELSSTVGIDEVSEGSFDLYPNPANAMVSINTEGVEGNVTVQIVDLNGRVMQQQQGNAQNFRFNVSALAQGTYFVRLTGENTNAIRKLIVK